MNLDDDDVDHRQAARAAISACETMLAHLRRVAACESTSAAHADARNAYNLAHDIADALRLAAKCQACRRAGSCAPKCPTRAAQPE